MNCPKCGKEMAEGWLSAGGWRIKWTPKVRSFAGIATGEEEILLQEWNLTGRNDTRACLCRTCMKIVIDLFPA